MTEVAERTEQVHGGEKLIPVAAAIIAVLAALATLFANHSSISGLAQKNEGILYQTKASDQYNYYESKRIKVQLNQALINAGLVRDAKGLQTMKTLMAKEDSQAKTILVKAEQNQTESDDHSTAAESRMQAYESFEVGATLFEVSIVLVSITALMQTRVLLYVASITSGVGLIFLISGFLKH